MAQDDIQGQVVDPSGNPVSGAIVELTKSFESNPVEEQTVLRTTTDSNGNYIFEFHPDGDGTTQDYHVSCYNHDGSAYVNSFNNPGVTADLPSNAIPDSVVVQNHATTWAQGDATWADDATDDGAQDMSISGDPQAATLSDSSESLEFDGVDDNGLFTMPSAIDGSNLSNISVEFALQWSNSTTISNLFGSRNGANATKLIGEINRDETFSDVAGSFYVQLGDDDANVLRAAPATNPGLNDGQRHDITIAIDAPNNNVTIIIDGSSVSVSYGAQQTPDNFSTLNQDMVVAARNEQGTPERFAQVSIGADRWHNETIAEQTISDYQ